MTTVTDAFTRADTAADLGAGWADVDNGGHGIFSNAAGNSGANVSCADRNVTSTGNDNMFAQVDIIPNGNTFWSCAALCRMPNTNLLTGYAVSIVDGFFGSGAYAYLSTFVAGGETGIGGPTLLDNPAAASYTAKVVATGSSISLYVNGLLVIGPVTDTTIATNQYGGIRTYSTTASQPRFDNFAAGDGTGLVVAKSPPIATPRLRRTLMRRT